MTEGAELRSVRCKYGFYISPPLSKILNTPLLKHRRFKYRLTGLGEGEK